jgi:hypothetical protein
MNDEEVWSELKCGVLKVKEYGKRGIQQKA